MYKSALATVLVTATALIALSTTWAVERTINNNAYSPSAIQYRLSETAGKAPWQEAQTRRSTSQRIRRSRAELIAETVTIGKRYGVDETEIGRRVERYEQVAGLLGESNFRGCEILPETCNSQSR